MELQKYITYFQTSPINGKVCVNPTIVIKSITGVDIACIKADGTVVMYGTPGQVNCVEAWITCDNCLNDPPIRIVKCFCEDNSQCTNCTRCNPLTKVCEPICPDQICTKDNTCADCDDTHPCPNGEVCTNGRCGCPPGWKRDMFGICRECVSDGDCSGCNICEGYKCKPKQCPAPYLLKPLSCDCVLCYDNTHCTEPNTCCTGDFKCECCPGYYRDPKTGKCEKIPKCIAGKCPPCYQCVAGDCVLTTCEPGRVHVGDDCCQLLCDCNNPTCPPGYSCTRKGNVCVCVNCDVACANGICPEGCQCASTKRCVPKPPDPCAGYCDENTPCPKGCGCDLILKRCRSCVTISCENQECDRYPGCKCIGNSVGNNSGGTTINNVTGSTTVNSDGSVTTINANGDVITVNTNGTTTIVDSNGNVSTVPTVNSGIVSNGIVNGSCGTDPCNAPCTKPSDCGTGCGCNLSKQRCEGCDRPCVDNGDCEYGCYCDKGTKRCIKNPCAGPCANGKDCAPGCGCWGGKGCYPCTSFTCVDCPDVNGCACIDGLTCDEKKPEGCQDILKVIAKEPCKLEGQLISDSCCKCDDISYSYNFTVDQNGVVRYTSILRKGHVLNGTPLDLTGIVNDFPPTTGIVDLHLKAYYADGSSTLLKTWQETWANAGVNNKTFTSNELCARSKSPAIRFEIAVFSTNFTFANNCLYTLPLNKVITVAGCGKATQDFIPFSPLESCKKPLFTWYKGDTLGALTKFREVYPTKVGNVYSDVLDTPIGLAACKYYKLSTDCSCATDAFYSCKGVGQPATRFIACSPKDLVINVQPNSCNKNITIVNPDICTLMNGQKYRLFINDIDGLGTPYGTYIAAGNKVFPGDIVITNYPEPIKTVTLLFDCDDCEKCKIVKTLDIINNCSCSSIPLNVTATNINCNTGFDLTIGFGTADFQVKIVRKDNSNTVFNVVNTVYTANGTYHINGPLVSGTYYITVIDKYGCTKEVSFVANCCELLIQSADYDCNTKLVRLVYTGAGGTFLQASIDGGTFIPIPPNNLINFGPLTNGAHTINATSSVPGCNGTITFTVNCCPDMDLQSVTTTDCLTLTLAYTVTPDEYRIDNGAWSPLVGNTIILLTALTPGTHRVSIRNSSNTNCMAELEFICTACPTYNIGTPVLSMNCATNMLELTGIVIPPNLEGCDSFYVRILKGGSVFSTTTYLWADWAATMSFPIVFTNGFEYKIQILSCNDCYIYDTAAILNPFTFDATYNCTSKLNIIRNPIGIVTYSGPSVAPGTPAPPNGTTLPDGTYTFIYSTNLPIGTCFDTKTLIIACSGGGGGGECNVGFGTGGIEVTQTGANIYIYNNGATGKTVTLIMQTLSTSNGSCSGNVLNSVTLGTLSPGNSLVTVYPYPNFDLKLVASYTNNSGTDVCIINKCLTYNTIPGACAVTNAPLICVINRANPFIAKIRITNPISNDAAFVTTKRLTANVNNYGTTILAPGANIEYSITSDLALPTNVGNYEVKLICTNDPGNTQTYVFSGIAQIPDC